MERYCISISLMHNASSNSGRSLDRSSATRSCFFFSLLVIPANPARPLHDSHLSTLVRKSNLRHRGLKLVVCRFTTYRISSLSFTVGLKSSKSWLVYHKVLSQFNSACSCTLPYITRRCCSESKRRVPSQVLAEIRASFQGYYPYRSRHGVRLGPSGEHGMDKAAETWVPFEFGASIMPT